jgi:hypothetical protein
VFHVSFVHQRVRLNTSVKKMAQMRKRILQSMNRFPIAGRLALKVVFSVSIMM